MQRGCNNGYPLEKFRELDALFGVASRVLAGGVRQRHHVLTLLRLEAEAAREVRVEDVEAARPEVEQPRLLVDEHIAVADLDAMIDVTLALVDAARD